MSTTGFLGTRADIFMDLAIARGCGGHAGRTPGRYSGRRPA